MLGLSTFPTENGESVSPIAWQGRQAQQKLVSHDFLGRKIGRVLTTKIRTPIFVVRFDCTFLRDHITATRKKFCARERPKIRGTTKTPRILPFCMVLEKRRTLHGMFIPFNIYSMIWSFEMKNFDGRRVGSRNQIIQNVTSTNCNGRHYLLESKWRQQPNNLTTFHST